MKQPDRKHPYRLRHEIYLSNNQPVFITFCTKQNINLTDAKIAENLINKILHISTKNHINIYAYCIMPDHIHVVIYISTEGGDLEKWVRYVKRETAKVVGISGLWQRSYWDRYARNNDELAEMVQYILHNPVRKRLCAKWTDWPYSWCNGKDNKSNNGPDIS